MTHLMPCPFCGSKATIVPFYNIWMDGDKLYRPECTKRACPLYIDTGFVTREDAIEFWNTRDDTRNGTRDDKVYNC